MKVMQELKVSRYTNAINNNNNTKQKKTKTITKESFIPHQSGCRDTKEYTKNYNE